MCLLDKPGSGNRPCLVVWWVYKWYRHRPVRILFDVDLSNLWRVHAGAPSSLVKHARISCYTHVETICLMDLETSNSHLQYIACQTSACSLTLQISFPPAKIVQAPLSEDCCCLYTFLINVSRSHLPSWLKSWLNFEYCFLNIKEYKVSAFNPSAEARRNVGWGWRPVKAS